jgi:multiple antibiotic resistance protein
VPGIGVSLHGAHMRSILTLFISTFSTLLAIIDPLEALPVYLTLVEGKGVDEQRRIARHACFYASLLLFFFLVLPNLDAGVFVGEISEEV